MKKLALFLGLILTLNACNADTNTQSKESSAAVKNTYKKGDIVAYFDEEYKPQKVPSDKTSTYRKYLGKNKEGYFMFQDFFHGTNRKHTDPFFMKDMDHLNDYDAESALEGKIMHFYPSGHKHREITFKDGKAEGDALVWYENGQLMMQIPMNKSKLNGILTSWYENGQKENEMTYVNDLENGISLSWHENGRKKYEVTYVNNKREGLYIYWYDNGQKHGETTFSNDKLNGTKKEWNRDGTEKPSRTFRHGEEIK